MSNNTTDKSNVTESGDSLVVKSPPDSGDALVVKSPADSFSSTLKTRSSTLSGSFRDDRTNQESPFLALGVAQMLLGVLMAVFGVLAIVHDASLSSVGAGLWGGAVAMASGVVGVLAGLRSCYSVNDTTPSRFSVTAFLALCLVSLAVSNLVVVLAVTGLVRDGQNAEARAIEEEKENPEVLEEYGPDWAPLMANSGLLLISCAQCLVTIVAGFRCYRLVCPCVRKQKPSSAWPLPDSPEPTGSFYSTSSKEMLISNWLGQQHRQNMVLITQPPIHGPHGPIFTLPAPPPMAPPSMIGYPLPNAPFLNPLVSRQYMMPRSVTSLSSHVDRTRRTRDVEGRRRHRSMKKRKRSTTAPTQPRPITEEDVARTYTGLDREIAEEFISIAMEHGTTDSRLHASD